MKKLIVSVSVLLGLALVIGLLALAKGKQFSAMAAADEGFKMPPSTVSSAVAESASWSKFYTAVGGVSARQGIMVSAELSGVVQTIGFDSGQEVEKGDLLVALDASTEKAQLKAAQAQLELAKIRLERSKLLRENRTVAQSELDSAEAQFLEAAAQVENIEAVIAKKEIRASFSGTVGIRQVNEGQFINAGTAVVSLQALDLMYVDFSLPQQRIGDLTTGMKVEVSSDSYPGRIFEGTLSAINPEIDVATRSVRLRAEFDNSDGALRAGMFVNVSAFLPDEREVVVIPATAILYAPYGESVFVISDTDSGKIVKRSFVRVGEARGDFVSVLDGLEAGSQIVSAGVFKLRNGAGVVVNNDLAPEAKMDPKPEDA